MARQKRHISTSKNSTGAFQSAGYDNLIECDKDAVFFTTGIPKKSVVQKLHDFFAPFVRRRWRGLRQTLVNPCRQYKKSPKKFDPRRKLKSLDEFLLMLMKLRLNLFNTNLAKALQFIKISMWPDFSQLVSSQL